MVRMGQVHYKKKCNTSKDKSIVWKIDVTEGRMSRVVDLRHVKEPQAEIRASEQNLSDFSRTL